MADQSEWFPPKFLADAFNCPYCMAYAHQEWPYESDYMTESRSAGEGTRTVIKAIRLSECQRCRKKAVWLYGPSPHSGALLHPGFSQVESPNKDLSQAVREDYQEAASILEKSPKAAAALLRRATERLCRELVADGSSQATLDENIRMLQKKGVLSQNIVQMMHTLRIASNNAVHAGGFLDDEDNHGIAAELFSLLNQIAKQAITMPKEQKELAERVNLLHNAHKNQKPEVRDEQKRRSRN